MTLQKTSQLESDGVTSALLSSYLAKIAPKDYVNYSDVSNNDVISAAKASLNATPTYVVVGKTAGMHSYGAIQKLLK